MNREYCCSRCGIIWFDKSMSTNNAVCPECENVSSEYPIFACDTLGWFYASEAVEEELKSRDRKIHYHKSHLFYKED